MYLKKLELQGFKSFPEKIRLEFQPGITAVVGPNGSGKSNISDAIRWVLGEQSAKSLRGAKMEDIIFAGTENRRPLNYAQVTMTVDNSDRALTMDFDEITITRKAFRSGESDFFINDVKCRLKDIHQLFMDTGIGKEGYSIVGQGRIEEILNSRSQDRRLLFEEAAGIIKYKARRQEAMDSLEKERFNLLRVQDLINELGAQLEPLRLQSERAKEYLSIRDRLKLIQINNFLLQVDQYQDLLEDINEKLSDLEQQIDTEKYGQEKLSREMEDKRAQKQKGEDALKAVRNRLEELRSQDSQLENQINLIAQQIEHMNQGNLRLEEEAESRRKVKEQKLQELSETEACIEETIGSFERKNEALSEKEKEYSDLAERMREAETKVEQYNSGIIEKIEDAKGIQNEIHKLESDYAYLEARKEQLIADREENRLQVEEKNKRQTELEENERELAGRYEKLDKSLSQILTEESELESLQKACRKELNGLSKSLHEASSRLRLLSELAADYEGYYKSVKSILKRKKSGDPGFSGIHGALGELIRVPAHVETAIEIALGASVQNIVTGTEYDAKQAIEYLKKSGDGRATFLPLNALSYREPLRGGLLKEKGVVGLASELIQYEAQYEPVVTSLLGRILVVDTLDNAMALFKKNRYTIRIVTLEGEQLSPGGAMTGGSVQKTSIFKRKRELAELEITAKDLESKEVECKDRLKKLDKQLELTEAAAEEHREQLTNCRMEQAAARQSLEQLNQELPHLLAKQGEFAAEDNRLMGELQNSNMLIRQARDRLWETEKETGKIKQELEQFQELMATDRGFQNEKIQELTNLKVELKGLEQRLSSIKENKARLTQEADLAETEIKVRLDEIQKNNDLANEKKQESRELGSQREYVQAEASLKAEETLRLEDEIKSLNATLDRAAAEEKAKIQSLSDLEKEKTRFTMRKEQLGENSRRLYDQMWDDYQLTYQRALEYPRLELSSEKLLKEEKNLKQDIAALGNVNVGAIEEYKDVSRRHDFLTSQGSDIQKAEKDLLKLIGELTRMMEAQFTEQFKKISDNFGIVFRDMFGGGRAYLQLADESNALESGIDIIAQPPGKNLQSMSLLSGGERALTATALLFGILRMKPSPFCILDEVEAALDDANVNRYADYIKRVCQHTQFILITHRKGTMEAADILYGITMQEQGVSKLVSVKFTDAA